MIVKVIIWCIYLLVMNPETQQGTLMRHEYPTKATCKEAAEKMQKQMSWKKPPNCFKKEKFVKGQNT